MRHLSPKNLKNGRLTWLENQFGNLLSRWSLLGFLLLTGSSLTFGQFLPYTQGRDYLEEQLKSKLDRVLNVDEYVLDIKVTNPSPSLPANNLEGMLPGLQVLGAKTQSSTGAYPAIDLGGPAELLIIFDKKVSKERTGVARD